MTEPDVEPRAEPAPAPRWRGLLSHVDWRAKARWVTTEYLIVVLGVLTAVGLNSWWGERQSRVREQAYLEQLAADLRTSEGELGRELRIQQGTERAAVALQRALLSTVRPPEDSLATWAIDVNYYGDPRPNLGTARALVVTGDLLLLRDPDVRNAVLALVERDRVNAEQITLWQREFVGAIDRLDGVVSNAALIAAHGLTPRLDTLTSSRGWLPPAGARRVPAEARVTPLLDQPAFAHVVRALRLSSAVLRGAQEQQLDYVSTARARVDAALAD